MFELAADVSLWKTLTIPVVAAAVGGITNWLAVWMTFNPLEFVGIRPPYLGWQGIIPSKARRMAGLAVQSILSKLITMREVIEVLDSRRLAQQIVEAIDPLIETWVDELMTEHYRVLWDNMPLFVRRQVYARVRTQMPAQVDALMRDVEINIDHLLDLRPMVEGHLEQNKILLNRVFLECGEQEFRFLVRSGWYFGGAFGVIQATLWYFFPVWWSLPLAGLIVGYATNWIALNLIFRPLNPHRIGPFNVQGLFLKRQKEVSESFCRIVIEEIVTLPRLIDAMINGAHKERTRALMRRHVKPLVDKVAGGLGGMTKLAVQTTLGPSGFAQIKESVAAKAQAEAQLPFEDRDFVRERGSEMQQMIQGRMEKLPPEEFQDLLRPCFQEDELKLILVGAALGAAAGFAQLILVFAV
ncbi:MAG: hypothetical protein PHP86_03535 [Nevskiales bacterium]|nr:hypothetical protein [Nevskiales bacterium]